MAKIDPGMCPICGNPICTNVPITCSEYCVHSSTSRCYQLGGDYGTCECSYDDLMALFGGTFRKNLGLDAKGYKLAEVMIRKLQQGKELVMLPDDLFEI